VACRKDQATLLHTVNFLSSRFIVKFKFISIKFNTLIALKLNSHGVPYRVSVRQLQNEAKQLNTTYKIIIL